MSKQQLIVECWEQMCKDAAGASELAAIHGAIVEHFGSGHVMSPAAIARTLADHGVRLRHPEVLEADRRWREQQQPFTADDLTVDSLALVERLERGEFEVEAVRQTVLQVKVELALLAKIGRNEKHRELANEYVQWLTVWLQNPAIFKEWVALRKSTDEFQERFGRSQSICG